MYKTLTEQLKTLLYFTYRYSQKENPDSIFCLNESYGVPVIVDDIAIAFHDYVQNYIEHLIHCNIDSSELEFNEQILKKKYKIENFFFEKLSVSIIITFETPQGGRFGYVYDEDTFEFDNDKIENCEITGFYRIDRNNVKNSVDGFTALFAHELLHAYEALQRHIYRKETLIQNAEKYGYRNNLDVINSKDGINIDKKRLSTIIYWLTPMETRAYCTQMIKNIEPKLSHCKTSNDACNLITKTVVWKNYQTIEQWVNNICNGTIFCSKEDIEKWWEEITGSRLSFNKISKRLKDKLDRAKHQMLTNVHKKITDSALKNDKWLFLSDSDDLLDDSKGGKYNG